MERDEDLMSRVKEDNIAAFDELVERYTDRLYAFAMRLSGKGTIAEDAVQEAFIKIWKNRKKFDESKSFRSWAFAILRNSALDILRKKREAVFSDMSFDEDDSAFEEGIESEDISVPETIDQKILQKAVEETMKTLTPDQRAAVMLHDIEGMTFEEAGVALGKPLNTVKSHYRRAILALRKKLKDRGLGG